MNEITERILEKTNKAEQTRTNEIFIDDPLNPSELARLMLDWDKLQKQADTIKTWIEYQIREIAKETVTVGNVRCTYSKARMSYEYETAAMDKLKEFKTEEQTAILAKHTETVTKTNWIAIVKDLSIETDEIPKSQVADPKATLKVLEWEDK